MTKSRQSRPKDSTKSTSSSVDGKSQLPEAPCADAGELASTEDEWNSHGVRYDIEACWMFKSPKDVPKKAEALWFCQYATVGSARNIVAGVVAGDRGGQFYKRRFVAELDCEGSMWKPGKTVLLRIEGFGADLITGKEFGNFDQWLTTFNEDARRAVEFADHVFWHWHEGNLAEGFKDGALTLRENLWKHPKLETSGILLKLKSYFAPWSEEVLRKLGNMAVPLFENLGGRHEEEGEEEPEEDLFSSGGITYEFDAGWELRPNAENPDRAITRWFVMYAPARKDQKSVAGIAAGYQGGGAFTMQRFYAKFKRKHWECKPGAITSLYFEDRMEDAITGEEYDSMEACLRFHKQNASDTKAALRIASLADNVFWRWHEGDVDEGFQGDSLLLRPELWDSSECKRDDDMIRMRSDYDPWIREVCQRLGLIGAPVFDADEDDE